MANTESAKSHQHQIRRRIVETATAILENRLCITEGARILRELAFDLGAQFDEPFMTFVGIDSETDAFPLGAVREYWNTEALAREDASRQRYETAVRSSTERACAELIRRFRWPSVV